MNANGLAEVLIPHDYKDDLEGVAVKNEITSQQWLNIYYVLKTKMLAFIISSKYKWQNVKISNVITEIGTSIQF